MEWSTKAFEAINGMAGKFIVLDALGIIFTQWLIIGLGCVWFGLVIHRLFQRKFFEGVSCLGIGLVAILVSWFLLGPQLKEEFAVPRPAAIYMLADPEESFSFPSTTALLAFAGSTVTLFFHRKIGIALFGFSLLVGAALVFVGSHYPWDVIGGGLIGIGLGSVLWLIWKAGPWLVASIIWLAALIIIQITFQDLKPFRSQ